MSEFPTLEIAKAYAEKKGYIYAHLWFNEGYDCAFFNPFKGSWKKSMDRHEANCIRAAQKGIHISGGGLYAPVRWGMEV